MSGHDFLQVCAVIALGMLTFAFALTIVRIILGPHLPDRVLALDMLVTTGIAYIAVVAIKTNFFLYLDVAISLGIVGFLATVAFARYVQHRGLKRKNAALEVSKQEAALQKPAGAKK